MGKTAILYGIHANLPALEAVAEDARRCGADRFSFRRVAYDVERLVAAFGSAAELSPEVRVAFVEWRRRGV